MGHDRWPNSVYASPIARAGGMDFSRCFLSRSELEGRAARWACGKTGMPRKATPKKSVRKVQQELPAVRESRRDTLIRLVKEYRKKTAIGSAIYKQADELLDEIREKLAANKRLPIGDGLYAVLVDRFEEQSKIWQPVAMKRWELQIQDANGAVVRMRDREKKSKQSKR